ncbi:MAG: hypothetical protein ACM3ML_24915 [Micromonosporaceae bacterium]
MADQPQPEVAVAGEAQLAPAAASLSAHAGRHGRPVSWASVVIIMVGFLAGGIGLVAGPTWWLFWAGTGLAAFGGIFALGTGIFNDWY